MSVKDFISEDFRKKSAEIVENIESQTSAEIVIAMRSASDDYDESEPRVGSLFMLIAGLIMMVLDMVCADGGLNLSAGASAGLCLVAFIVGHLLCRAIPPLYRLCIFKGRMAEAVADRAKARFMDLGMSRTFGRNGILFYISLLEKRIVVLPDIGVDEEALGDEWISMKAELSKAMENMDTAALEAAMLKAGPILGKVMPHRDDDVNELPDMMQTDEDENDGTAESEAK